MGDLPMKDAPLPCKAFDTDGRVLLCSSFSKTLYQLLSRLYRLRIVAEDACAIDRDNFPGRRRCPHRKCFATPLASGRYERHLRRMRLRCARRSAHIREIKEPRFFWHEIEQAAGRLRTGWNCPGGADTYRLYDGVNRVGVVRAGARCCGLAFALPLTELCLDLP